MAAGLVVGAGFLTMTGFRAYRNYIAQDAKDTPAATNERAPQHQRMDGVVNRLLANPRLLEQYNEKYIDKKLSQNSALRRTASKNVVQRSRSQELQRRASNRTEKDKHAKVVEGIDSQEKAA